MSFDLYESLQSHNVWHHMIAGALAGTAEHCAMFPLDVVKTRMQSLSSGHWSMYSGLWNALRRMTKEEGLFRPYRGISAVFVGVGPAHSLYFASYEYLKDTLLPHYKGRHTLSEQVLIFVSGAMASILHDIIMTPTEAIKQKLQMYNSPYKSALDCVVKVRREGGLKTFYLSYTTQLAMNIPFQGIHFVAYETMSNVFNKDQQYNPVAHMMSGGIAGGFAAAVTTPLDVCKTLLNTQDFTAPETPNRLKLSGMIDSAKAVYKLGGVKGFAKGLIPRVLIQMPSTALSWSVYELCKHIFDKN